jgi:hypothetical protein
VCKHFLLQSATTGVSVLQSFSILLHALQVVSRCVQLLTLLLLCCGDSACTCTAYTCVCHCMVCLCSCRVKAHLSSVGTLQRACEAATRHGQIAVLQWLTALLHALDNTSSNASSSSSNNSSSDSSSSSSNQQQQQAAAALTVAAETSSTSSGDAPHSPGVRIPPAPGTAETFSETRSADVDSGSSGSSIGSSSCSGAASSSSSAAVVRTAMMDKAAAAGQLSTLQWIAANMRCLRFTSLAVYHAVHCCILLCMYHLPLCCSNEARIINVCYPM